MTLPSNRQTCRRLAGMCLPTDSIMEPLRLEDTIRDTGGIYGEKFTGTELPGENGGLDRTNLILPEQRHPGQSLV